MIIATVGMPGSGKSTVSEYLREKGFQFIKFGRITLDEVKKRGLEPTEENERKIREEIRKKHGMGAYAILSIPKIDELKKKGNVVIDGLYSWEEYLELKKKYGDELFVLCLYSPPKTRYERLTKRPSDYPDVGDRKFDEETVKKREHAEIEKMNKGGPIAMADYTILNIKKEKDMLNEVDDIIEELKINGGLEEPG